MSKVPVGKAKYQLPRLVHEAEGGTPVHFTRHGKPVAVLISEDEYARLVTSVSPRSFWDSIQELRSSPEFEPVDWQEGEVESWRQQDGGREFSWED